MVDINLHQAAEKDLQINKRNSILKSSPFFSIIILLVVMVTYGITILYQNSLKNKKDKLDQAKEAEIQSFDVTKINQLVDFQDRADSISFNIKNKENPGSIFNMMENLIVKGSFLNSLTYDSVGNKVEVEIVADSFRLAASQILNLKKSDLVEDVKVLDSGRNKDGQALFTLEISLKKNLKS